MINPSTHARTAAELLDEIEGVALAEDREWLVAVASAHALVAIALQLTVDVTMVQKVDG